MPEGVLTVAVESATSATENNSRNVNGTYESWITHFTAISTQ